MRPETVRRVAPLAVAFLVLLVIGRSWAALQLGDDAGAQPTTPARGLGSGRLAGAAASWPAGCRPGPARPTRATTSPPAPTSPTAPARARFDRLDPARRGRRLEPAVGDGRRRRTPSPAAGWVRRGAAGPAYPLVTARSAYEALVRTPLPMPLMACPEPLPPDADPVPCGGPVTVTGARLGLSLQQSADGLLLVPAWLFDVEGSPKPLVQLAVDPSLLQPLAPDQGGGSGGPAARPVPPGLSAPRRVARRPTYRPRGRGSARSTRAADDRSLTVTFYGGVPECYSYAVRAAETDKPVRLCGGGDPHRRRQAVHRPGDGDRPRRCRWTRRSGSDRSSTPRAAGRARPGR